MRGAARRPAAASAISSIAASTPKPGGGRVFDGVIAHVAGAGRMNMNRFANLMVAGGQQYEDHGNATDTFPFAYDFSRTR